MKLIKKGQNPATRIWVGTCQTCGSEFESFENELTRIQHDQREESWSWEKCPECGGGNDSVGNYGGVCFHLKKVTTK